jgi:hypothetical protein
MKKEAAEEGVSDQEWGDSESEEESLEDVDRKALKSLYRELMEEVFDEYSFPLNCELNGLRRKGKSHAKSCLTKTCKARKAKVFKKSFK